MKARLHSCLVLCFIVAMAGCTNRRPPNVVRPFNPPKMPEVPRYHAQALDVNLLQSARQQIAGAFTSTNPIIRAHAIEAIQNTVGREMAGQILTGLTDRDAIVRFASAMAAGQLQLVEARSAVEALVNDPDASVRVGARFALHRLGDTSRSHDLERTSKDPVTRTRADTAMVLGMMGERSASRILLPMLHDREFIVRIQSAEALWRLGDERGLDSLVGATVSAYPDDQMVGLLALAAPKDVRVSQNLRGALTSDYDEVSLIAARALGIVASDEGFGVALKGSRSIDARQRVLAALALGAIGRSDAQDTLRKMLTDPDADVRLAAATAILQLKPPA